MNMKLIARTRAAFFKLCGKHAPLSFRRARQGFQRNSPAKTQAAARVDAFRCLLYDESAGRLAQLVRAPARHWLESHTVTARWPKIPDVSMIVFMHLHESSFLFRAISPQS